ncbi:MAG: hypothetical protein OEY22_05600 [Candidatus Bathyarchaeota archaeon]|nr:hypothetical protein [Candidatus Bathyarchaeota archaeon]MDH5787960.1 hypothetical protein [Candidatus Bathyarchaeota archaeon]
MVYGELQGKALEWAAKFVFELDPTSMPSQIVISPFKFEKYCGEFRNLVTDRGLKLEKTGNSFLVRKGSKHVLFGSGGIGASNFADSSYILCHCKNAEEIIFVGTGGGVGTHLESADINRPPTASDQIRSLKSLHRVKLQQRLTLTYWKE